MLRCAFVNVSFHTVIKQLALAKEEGKKKTFHQYYSQDLTILVYDLKQLPATCNCSDILGTKVKCKID